jgi:hypothetical protein
MSQRVRNLVVAFIVLAGLSLVTAVVSTISESPPRSPPPNPNGYDDFLKAGGEIIGDVGNFQKLDPGQLRELVLTNEPALRFLRLGLAHHCSLPTEIALTNLQATLSVVVQFKELTLLLAAEGRLAELDNRPMDAARSYVDAISLGNEVSRGGFLINRLVGVACEAIGAKPLARLLPALDPAQVRPLVTNLEQIDAARVSWDQIQREESRLTRYELRKGQNPITWATAWWQSRAAWRNAEARHFMALAHLRLFQTELALRCYQAEQRQVPRDLGQLVPGYLGQVPLDPFSDRPMVYHPRGTSWLLYSVGMDRVDDGGHPVGKGVSSKGDLFFDSPW